MNSAVLAILGAIAAIVATIGFVLFGKPSGGTTTGPVQPTEKVLPDLPVEPETAPLEETPVPDVQPIETADVTEVPVSEDITTGGLTVDSVTQPETIDTNGAYAEPNEAPIEINLDDATQADEVTVSEDITTGGLTLDSVTQPDTIDPNEAYYYADEAPIEINLDDATQANDMSNEMPIESPTPQAQPDSYTFTEPLTLRRAQPVPPMATVSNLSPNNPPIQHAPYSALNDPKRPKSLEAQKISQQLLTWGESPKNATQVITYSQDADPMIRKYVAQALTMMTRQTSDRTTIPTVISTLEKLSQDADPGVKSIAQSGLG